MEDNFLFERESIPRAYFQLALPVVFSMVVSLVYNMADTYFIALTQNTSLIAGISIGAPVFTLMIALGDIFGLGGSSVISRLLGERKETDVRRISSSCFYGALILGAAVTVLLLSGRKPLLTLLGADPDTMLYADQYFTGIILGAPAIILSFTPSNILRTEGLSRESMLGTILGSVINLLLDPLFILVLGMGSGGAALATVIGYIGSYLYFTWVLLKRSHHLSIQPSHCHINRKELAAIGAIGIPASVTNLMQSLSTALTNRSLLPYGNDEIAAMGIAMKINMLVALVLVGFAFGAQPLIGYNYGARHRKELRDILKFSFGFVCSLALFLSFLLCLAAPYLTACFVEDCSLITEGTRMLRLLQTGMVFMAVVLVTTCTFQSAGKALGAFLLYRELWKELTAAEPA